MYTAKVLSKAVDAQTTKQIVTVEFTDGNDSFSKVFTFPPQVDIDYKKAVVNRYIRGLNESSTNVDAIPEGNLDMTGVPDGTQTQAELDREEWFKRWTRLLSAQILIDHGIIPNDHTKVTQLRTWLTNNFQAEYIDTL